MAKKTEQKIVNKKLDSNLLNSLSSKSTSEKIIAKCITEFPSHNNDCNEYLKAVSNYFFSGDIFNSKNANEIIIFLSSAQNGWKTTRKISDAISQAKAGNFVIVGLKGSPHGHVAVVVGLDGQQSGNVKVPIGYAGSLDNPDARIAGARLSGTFNAQLVRDEKIDYFYRAVEIEPALSSFNLLLEVHQLAPKLAWGKHVSPLFKEKVFEICGELNASPDHLMACMAFETAETFSPSVKNEYSGATGLIQFMPQTAKALGTTTQSLATMTAVEQLEYVKKYLLQWQGKYASLSDLYMSILLPAAIGKPENHVLFKQGSTAYDQNKGLDLDRDGQITKLEATKLVQKKLDKGLNESNLG